MLMDHDYSGDIIIEYCIAEVPSEDPQIFEFNDISVVSENENETPNMNMPVQEMSSQGHSKSTATISALRNAPSSKNILGPIRTRAKRTNYMRRSGLEYLKDKHEKEMKIEEKKLILEEMKIAVSERTIALAEKKFSFESEHNKNLFESQHEIIKNLLNIVKDLKSTST